MRVTIYVSPSDYMEDAKSLREIILDSMCTLDGIEIRQTEDVPPIQPIC